LQQLITEKKLHHEADQLLQQQQEAGELPVEGVEQVRETIRTDPRRA
jgi:hypothetical protein